MLRSETAGEPEKMAAALHGLRAYQAAPREPRPAPMPEIARIGRASLLDYGGEGRPVVFVPSLINPPHVLDLLPDVSMLRWLSTQGLRPLLVDWGEPDKTKAGLTIAGHVETLLLPLMETVGPDAAMAGYCLGGTMALAAATLRPPAALALIATPWRFSGFPDEARRGMAEIWGQAHPTADAMGLLPVEALQAAFWRLDPRRTVEKFITFGQSERGAQATRRFVALEDWANDGAPLTPAAGRELAEAMFGRDDPGEGRWTVGGRVVDPAALACPLLDIISTTDRIVPAASATGAGERVTLAQGHVGMVVGGRARASLWQTLAEWLTRPHMA